MWDRYNIRVCEIHTYNVCEERNVDMHARNEKCDSAKIHYNERGKHFICCGQNVFFWEFSRNEDGARNLPKQIGSCLIIDLCIL